MSNINKNDVLLGRGKKIYEHYGNHVFRTLIKINKECYSLMKRRQKFHVSKHIVQTIKDNNGRFMGYDSKTTDWLEVSDSKAMEKVSQALREKRASYDYQIPNTINQVSLKYNNIDSINTCDEIGLRRPTDSEKETNKNNSQNDQTDSMREGEFIFFDKSLKELCREEGIKEKELDKLILQTFT